MLIRLGVKLPYGNIATNILPLNYAIEDDEGKTACRFVLHIHGYDEPVYTRDLPAAKRQTVEVMLSSHLLPDGEIKIEAVLQSLEGLELDRHALRLDVHNPGPLAEKVRESLRRSGKALVSGQPCDTSEYDYGDTSLLPWYEKPDAMAHIDARLQDGSLDTAMAEQLRHFVVHGYIVLENCIEPELLAEIRAQMDEVVETKYQNYVWGSSQRVTQLHQKPGGVNKLWRHRGVEKVLQQVFESEPRSCQTLTYIFGSQQDAHQDTIHLTPFPAGYMCGVWAAIDDVMPDSGELVIYPGSHRLPRSTMREANCAKVLDGTWGEFGAKVVRQWKEMIDKAGMQPLLYRPKAGTVLIWHENLMHGGSKRIDQQRSRRSVVSHMFANGAVAFYDSLGRPGYMHPMKEMA